MKIEIESLWDSNRKRPNVYFVFQCENKTERALLLSLYAVKPKFIPNSNGQPTLDFYPDGR